MSAETASIASSWSARLAVGERALQLQLPLRVGAERVAAAGLPLGVQAQQLARQLAGGAAGARLDGVPALRAQGRELWGVGAGAHVAGDLRQLVGGREDPVLATVFELEVVARDVADCLRLEAGEPRDPVVFVHDVVANAQVDRRREAPPHRRRRRGAAAVDQPPVREDGELQVGRGEPVGQLRLGERQLLGRPGAHHLRLQALEVVARALGLAQVIEGDDHPVARTHLLLQLPSASAIVRAGELGAWARSWRSWPESTPEIRSAARAASGSATST